MPALSLVLSPSFATSWLGTELKARRHIMSVIRRLPDKDGSRPANGGVLTFAQMCPALEVHSRIAHLSAITGNSNYGALASKALDWFADKSRAKTKMYDPETGRCLDGINDSTTVNRNSGAESTIGALIALQFSVLRAP